MIVIIVWFDSKARFNGQLHIEEKKLRGAEMWNQSSIFINKHPPKHSARYLHGTFQMEHFTTFAAAMHSEIS